MHKTIKKRWDVHTAFLMRENVEPRVRASYCVRYLYRKAPAIIDGGFFVMRYVTSWKYSLGDLKTHKKGFATCGPRAESMTSM